jgi:hypothetical protein
MEAHRIEKGGNPEPSIPEMLSRISNPAITF